MLNSIFEFVTNTFDTVKETTTNVYAYTPSLEKWGYIGFVGVNAIIAYTMYTKYKGL